MPGKFSHCQPVMGRCGRPVSSAAGMKSPPLGCNPNCRIASPARSAEWATVGAWADNNVNPAPLPKGGSDNLGCTPAAERN